MGLFDRLLGPNIGKLESHNDIEALAKLVQSNDRRDMRTVAIEALARIGGSQATRSLVGALFVDDPDVVRASETALTGFGSAAGTELVEALGQPGDDGALNILLKLDEEAVEFLRAACTHQDEGTRLRALGGLVELDARLDNAAVRETLFRALLAALGDRSAECRVLSASTLGGLNDGRASRALAAQLKDGDENVRTACRDALEAIGEPAVPYLLDALADRNAKSRRLAAELLGGVCRGEVRTESRRIALSALADRASDSKAEIAAAVRQALEAIPSDAVISEQLDWLADPERSDHEDIEEFLTLMVAHGGLPLELKTQIVERTSAASNLYTP